MKNEIGNVYGRLTVLERAEKPQGRPKGAYWLCQCECGNKKVVRGADLRNGGTKSCGCLLGQHSIKNEIGNKYGKLTVIAKSSQRESGSVCWVCKCECGKETIVAGDSLRKGDTKSCGCLVGEKSREVNGNNLTNQKFAKLTALKINEEETIRHGKHGLYWDCVCECGNHTTVLGSNLLSGSVKSCGCMTTSWGEEVIEKILQENNVLYQKEYCFLDLSSEKNVKLRFDFAIFDKNNNLHHLIEFDGEQHFKPVPHWGGEDGLKHRQENDSKKNDYCKSNNIHLIRIPYWDIQNISKELLEVTDELSFKRLDNDST